MSEKLLESVTFKCTPEEKKSLELLAEIEKISLSEFMRVIAKAKIKKAISQAQLLSDLLHIATDTRDTFVLAPPPKMIDVTPSPQKKATCCEQMTFLLSTP